MFPNNLEARPRISLGLMVLQTIALNSLPTSHKTLAEMRGFEPLDRFYPIDRLANDCLKPDSATFPNNWRRR